MILPMGQSPTRSFAEFRRLTALASPACELCALPTRFVGLECIPDSDDADLCTYECSECGHVQANVVARIKTHRDPFDLYQ